MESDSAMLRRIVRTRKFEKLDPERLLELADMLEKHNKPHPPQRREK